MDGRRKPNESVPPRTRSRLIAAGRGSAGRRHLHPVAELPDPWRDNPARRTARLLPKHPQHLGAVVRLQLPYQPAQPGAVGAADADHEQRPDFATGIGPQSYAA